MNAFVAWFDALDTGYQWALVCGTALVLMLLGIGLSLARRVSDESDWLSDAWNPEPPAPVKRSSPFAPRRSVVVVGDGSDLNAQEVKEVASK